MHAEPDSAACFKDIVWIQIEDTSLLNTERLLKLLSNHHKNTRDNMLFNYNFTW